MEYTRLGRSGLTVSHLRLGCMGFPRFHGHLVKLPFLLIDDC